jgi:hypothetical protein
VARDHVTFRADQNRTRATEGPDARGDLRHLGIAVGAGIARGGEEPPGRFGENTAPEKGFWVPTGQS